MPVDPQLQPLLDLLATSGAPSITSLQPEAARALMAAMRGNAREVEVHTIADHTAPGPAGDVPVRVYSPAGEGPFPLLVWIHGGGWVLGSVEESDPVARGLSVAADCVVASIEYHCERPAVHRRDRGGCRTPRRPCRAIPRACQAP